MKKNSRSILAKLVIIGFTIIFLSCNAQAAKMGTVDTSKPQVEKIQNFIEKLMQEDKSIDEISIHATGLDGNTKRIACTTTSKIGTRSDPEDIDAIIENKVILISLGDILDVTVPMTNEEGIPAAVAGIHLYLKDGLDNEGAKKHALDIAKKISKVLMHK